MPAHNPPKGIQPSHKDVGRRVIYRAAPGYEPEPGVITSVWDVNNAFVQFKPGCTSQRCSTCDLDWENP